MASKTRILFTCGREPGYVRNLLLLRALRQHFEVLELTDHGTGSLLLRNLRLLPRLLPALRQGHDLVCIGFYGHLLALFLSRLTRKPILFDAFLSTWDTLCFDRKRFGPHSLPGRLAFWLDRHTSLAAQHVLLDTHAQTRYFVDTFDIPATRVSAYYLGYDAEIFFPRPDASQTAGRFTVLFYGSFLPLQGVEHIVEAAKLLESEREIRFRIIGEGMSYAQVRRLADQLQVQSLTFQASVPYHELPNIIAEASVCLGGPFGSTNKANRVIASKTFQALAMAKPTIVGDTPANRELFRHGEDVWMCKTADAQALAAAILGLKQDAALRESIARRGYERCEEEFSIERQGGRLKQLIAGML